MKTNTFINKNGIIIYMGAIVLTIILNMQGYAIINNIISTVFKIFYFIILAGAILSFYKGEKKNIKALIFIFLPFFLLFTGIPFKEITMLIIFPLFFSKDIKLVIKVIGIIIYLILILLGIIGICFENFGLYKAIDYEYSPNAMYRVVTIDSDEGALGGDTYVKLERMYCGIMKKNIKTLYHGKWGEKPKLIWIDNNIVNVNGRDMNIHTSKTWENDTGIVPNK